MTSAAGLLFLTAMIVVGPVVPALGQVSCSTPDNLCTGDPCVIPSLEVASPCVVDFGGRTVVVDATLRVPVDGVLSLTAGSFNVAGVILGSGATGSGAAVTLTASGDIDVRGRIRLMGSQETGTITLHAGGDIRADGWLSTRGRGDAGEVRLTAQGSITTGRMIDTSGGRGEGVWLTAGANVDLNNVRGSCSGHQCAAGYVVIRADGFVTVRRTVRLRGFEGGVVDIEGDAGVDVQGALMARKGGYLAAVSANGPVHVRKTIRTYSPFTGGGLQVRAHGDVTIDGSVLARSGPTGESSAVEICSQTGNLIVNARMVATYILIDVAGSATLNGDIDATGITGQIVSIRAATIQVSAAATVRTDDQFGDSMVFEATGGDLQMSGTFLARGLDDGIIQGSATGNLLADGRFEVLSNCPSPPCGGCIGLSAGGTLDTSGGSFDVAPVATCNEGTIEICS